jgi:hypothetical protein
MKNNPVTLRSQLTTGSVIDATNNDPQNGQGFVTGNQQLISSFKKLTNTEDLGDARRLDDYQHTFSSLTGNVKITKNNAKGIDLTKAPNILGDNVPVPANSSQGVDTSKITSAPGGNNEYTNGGNPVTTIGLSVAGGIANLIAAITNFFLGDELTAQLARSVNIPTNLESCTLISNDVAMRNHVKDGTTAMLPLTINTAIDKLEDNGEKSNAFNNPVVGSNGTDRIQIKQKYTYTNKTIAYEQFAECKSLSYHDPEYTLRCGIPNTLITQYTTIPNNPNPRD